MPSVRFTDHAVFGGGGGGGPAPVDPQIAIDAAAAAEKARLDALTAAEKAAEEKRLLEIKQAKEAEDAGTAASDYADTTGQDLTKSRQKLQDKLNKANLELSNLSAQDQTNPKIAEKVSAKQADIQKLQAEMVTLSTAQGAEMAASQRDLTAKALKDPTDLVTKTPVDKLTETVNQIIGTGTGDAGDASTATASTADTTAKAPAPDTLTPASVLASASKEDVDKALSTVTAAKGDVSTTVDAAKGDPTKITGLGTEDITQVDPTKVVPPPARVIEDGEIVSGAANAATASAYTEQIEAATATPSKKATVKGQLDTLMDDFEGGETPVWAAGAMRAATAAMAARGLGASSMAGQAIVQAAMESALPIAQADAAITAQFEAQNLSNRQQRAMLAAQQRATFMGHGV